MNEKDLEIIISQLSKRRPIFHSEADFQFSLAQEISKNFPQAEIRLERPFGNKLNKYLDILVQIDNSLYPIELKHLTKKLNPTTVDINGEQFHLKQQGAQDLCMYNCLKDVQRVEELSKESPFKTGFVIWLTNDKSYWSEPKNPNVNYAPFSIHDEAIKTNEMMWPAGMLKNKSINLKGRYKIKWKLYSNLGDNIKNGEYKYVLLTIKQQKTFHDNAMKSTIQDRMNDPWWEEPADEEMEESFENMVKQAKKIDKEIEKIKKKTKTNEQE